MHRLDCEDTMLMTKRIFVVLVPFLFAGCATTAPATTATLPKERATECKAHCHALDMELGAVVVVMNSTGCVCTPQKSHSDDASALKAPKSMKSDAQPAVNTTPNPPSGSAAKPPSPQPAQKQKEQSEAKEDDVVFGGAAAVTETVQKKKKRMLPMPEEPRSYFAQ